MDVDSKLSVFASLCEQIEFNTSLTVKQEIIGGFLARYKGDVGLLFKHLLPKFNGRLYHLQDKQLVKILAPLVKQPEAKLMQHVKNSGCIAKSVQSFFQPRDPSLAVASELKLEDLDGYLNELAATGTEDVQSGIFTRYFRVASPKDVFVILRQIKQDLRLGAGIRVVLNGLHPSANDIYKQCANVQKVVKRVLDGDTDVSNDNDDGEAGGSGASRSVSPSKGKNIAAGISLNTPLAPMLAAPSKGLDWVLGKCPNGAYSETKYDGERIQIHKDGDSYKYFARSLKPMKADKYEGLDVYLKKAIKANSVILDGEILLVDLKTSQPLPFGSLGKHKKAQFKDACTCIFIFDIMFYNGMSVIGEPLDVRRALIKEAVDFIPNRIMISEMREVIGTPEQRTKTLRRHLGYAITEGLEGLVCKDIKSVYAPGNRYWIKLKKDYLDGLADSADLVVLGGYYGSGNKGGMLSIFLMGVWDKTLGADGKKRFKTVCKVGNGHDDATLEALNKKYKESMAAYTAPPEWIDVHNSHRPDVYVKDPMNADVWEVIGAEFSQTKTHTANGVSIRFPRINKIRDDKDVNMATNLEELVNLVKASKQKFEKMGMEMENGDDDGNIPPPPVSPPRSARVGELVRLGAGGGGGGASSAVVPAVLELDDAPVPVTRHTTLPPAAAPPKPLGSSVTVPLAHTAPSVHDTTPQQAPATNAGPGTYQEVAGDAAQPVLDRTTMSMNVIIAHSVSNGGKWSNRGVMGSIAKYLGDEPEEEYNKMSSLLTHGKVQFVEVSNRSSSAKMFVATMVGQDSAKRHTVLEDALLTCLRKCAEFASKRQATLHISKPDKAVCPSWASAEALLQKLAGELRLHVVVYNRAMMRQGSLVGTQLSSMVMSPPQSAPTPTATAPQGFTRLSTSGMSAGVATGAAAATTPPKKRGMVQMGSESPTSMLQQSTALFGDTAMENVKIALLGFQPRDQQAVEQKALMLGAVVVKDATTATHIVTSAGQQVSGAQPGQKCVSRQWIDDCFMQNKCLDTTKYSTTSAAGAVAPGASPLRGSGAGSMLTQSTMSGSGVFEALKHCCVVVNGFPESAQKEIENKLKMMGASIAAKWTLIGAKKTTHMITASWNDAAERAAELGGTVVSRGWVDVTLEKGVMQNVRKYLFEDLAKNGAAPSAPQAHVHSVPTLRTSTSPQKPTVTPPKARHQQQLPAAASIAAAPTPQRPPTQTGSKRQRIEYSPNTSSDEDNDETMTGTPASKNATLLKGKRIGVEGYGLEAAKIIRKKVEALGGTFIANTLHCDVIICETLTAVSTAIADKGKVVTRKWINHCFSRNSALALEKYKYFTHKKGITVAAPVDAGAAATPVSTVGALTPPVAAAASAQQAAVVAADIETEPDNDDEATVSYVGSTEDDDEVPPAPQQQRRRNVPVDLVSTEDDDDANVPEAQPRKSSKMEDQSTATAAPATSAMPELPPAVMSNIAIAVGIQNDMDRRAVERYHTAYGGDIVQLEATHIDDRLRGTPSSIPLAVIVASDSDARAAKTIINDAPVNSRLRQAVLVKKDWVMASIRQGNVLPTQPFLVL